MHAQQDESAGTVVLHLEGSFDRDAARRAPRFARRVGRGLPGGARLLRVTAFRDLAIDALVRGLRADSIYVRGLAVHQERCFATSACSPPPRAPTAIRDDDAAHPA